MSTYTGKVEDIDLVRSVQEHGWRCPVCGSGVSPRSARCPCIRDAAETTEARRTYAEAIAAAARKSGRGTRGK